MDLQSGDNPRVLQVLQCLSTNIKYPVIKANLTQIITEVRKSSRSIKLYWGTIFNPNFNLRIEKTIRIQPWSNTFAIDLAAWGLPFKVEKDDFINHQIQTFLLDVGQFTWTKKRKRRQNSNVKTRQGYDVIEESMRFHVIRILWE